MFFDKFLKIKRKQKKKQDKNTIDYFTSKLAYLFNVLVSAYYTPMLKWWETIIVVIVGVLSGIGLGIAIYQIYIAQPKVVIIPLNETHIIRVRP